MGNEQTTALQQAIISGDATTVGEIVQQLLDDGTPPELILNDMMIPAMDTVGDNFERGEIFVPEMLIAARAMQEGLTLLRPVLAETGIEPLGTIVIGTVQGDMHDIGKNLVSMMLEGAGFAVVDLGVDVKPQGFVDAVKQHQPTIVCMSALLTTTMPNMKTTIEALQDAGVRDTVTVLVGGAPVTEEFAQSVGADGYASDAGRAAKLAQSLLS